MKKNRKEKQNLLRLIETVISALVKKTFKREKTQNTVYINSFKEPNLKTYYNVLHIQYKSSTGFINNIEIGVRNIFSLTGAILEKKLNKRGGELWK